MEIDENVIYKKAFETMMDVEDWCFELTYPVKKLETSLMAWQR